MVIANISTIPTSPLSTKTRILFAIARALLAIAWLLLLICMALRQVAIDVGNYSHISDEWYMAPGVVVMAASLAYILIMIKDFLFGSPGFSLNFSIAVISILVSLSNLLFIISPLVLVKFKAGNCSFKSIYWVLNVVCTVMFFMGIRRFTSGGTEAPEFRLLPNMFLWLGAQIMLTLSASVRLVGEYVAMRYGYLEIDQH